MPSKKILKRFLSNFLDWRDLLTVIAVLLAFACCTTEADRNRMSASARISRSKQINSATYLSLPLILERMLRTEVRLTLRAAAMASSS